MIRRLGNTAIKHWQYLTGKAFVRDVMTLQVGSVFAQGLGFVKSVLLARLLGLEGFGVYAVVLSMTGTLKVFTGFGQEQAFTTYAAEAFGEKNMHGLKLVFKYFFYMSLIAAVLLVAFAIMSPWLAEQFYEEHVTDIGRLAQVAFLAFVASLPHPYITGILQTLRKIRILTALENGNLLLQTIICVGLIWYGMGAMGAFVGLLISNVVMSIIYMILYGRARHAYMLPSIWESIRTKGSIKSLLVQGVWISIDKNIINFYQQALLFLFSIFSTPIAVGLAQIALKVSNVPASLFFAHAVRMAGTVIPAIKAQGIDVLKRQCALLVKHALLFHSIIVFACMITFPFAVLWAYGAKFSAVIYPMEWMLLIRLLQPFNVATTSLLRAFKKMQVSTLWNGCRIFVELGIFTVLLRYVFEQDPLIAFVFAVLVHQIGAFLLNIYVYGTLLKIRST